MTRLHHTVRSHAVRHPDKLAIVCGGQELTYRGLWQQIEAMAAFLRAYLAPGDRVGVALDNRAEAVCALYAAPAAGMIAVPIDAGVHRRNLERVWDHAGLSLLVTTAPIAERAAEHIARDALLLVDDAPVAVSGHGAAHGPAGPMRWSRLAGAYHRPLEDRAGADDVAAIFYTTGTTGEPKGVTLTHRNLLSSARNINQFIGTGASAVESAPMPISHSFGFGRVRCVLSVGGTLLLEDGFARHDRVLANMIEYGATGLSSVPAGFSFLLEYFGDSFARACERLEYVEIGSSPMALAHKRQLAEMCPRARLCMHYGLTEASRACFLEFHADREHLDSVGRPAPNVAVEIRDEHGGVAAPGEVGTIAVAGEMVTPGYWRDPENSRAALRDGWLVTGDLGVVDADGYVHLRGRASDIINVAGLKVAPHEIEDALCRFPGVREAAVVGVPEPGDAGESGVIAVTAFVVAQDASRPPEPRALVRHCAHELEAHKVPRRIQLVDALPRTSSGKLKRHELRERPA